MTLLNKYTMSLVNKYAVSRWLFGNSRKMRTTGKNTKAEHVEIIDRLENKVIEELKIIKLELTENQPSKEKD